VAERLMPAPPRNRITLLPPPPPLALEITREALPIERAPSPILVPLDIASGVFTIAKSPRDSPLDEELLAKRVISYDI
jgi:hypothetical protein